jgi:hypothetical protein
MEGLMFKNIATKTFAISAFAVAAAFSMAVTAPAAKAEDSVKVGVLNCQVDGGTGFVFGSTKKLRCVYSPSGVKRGDRYTGQINKYGVDLGVTGNAVMTWAVFAPTSKVGRGALAGEYVGPAANASVGIGAGANVLIGGSNKTVSLQPLSLQGQTGLNAAVTIASLQLHAVK